MEFKDLIKKILRYNKDSNITLIDKAYNFSKKKLEGHKRASGKMLIEHQLDVADLTAELKADDETICCALLHGLTSRGVEEKEIENLFGKTILELLKNLELMRQIKNNVTKNNYEQEGLRKVLIAASKDIRVLIVKLCDKLINLREIEYLEEPRIKKISKESLEIYAPLAYRLGIGRIKSEMEDLAFKNLEPEKYKTVKDKIDSRIKNAEQKVYRIKKTIEQRLKDEKIDAEIKGRVKQIYSIYKKMSSKDEYKDAIPYDVIGLRIITEKIEECYNILRIVHSLFRYVPDRLKDYIALPKPNGYQSIHTGIIDEDGSIIEIQIRTKDMDENAEDGIAAHFTYKGIAKNKEFDKKISWIKELVHENNKVDINFFSEVIFVFTPKGKAIELPKGSTPIDFGYMLHTDIGRTCVGAKINNNIAQLNTELENGDVVEIITNKNHNAVKDWLKFVKTNKAREKIKHDIKARTGLSINAMQKKEEVKEEAGYGLIKLENHKDKKIRLAQCCNPLPGDDIEGTLNVLKSALIHKKNCINLKNNNKKCLARWIDPKNYYVEIIVVGKDRVGLFTEILNSASSIGINIKDAKGKTTNQNNIECRFGINIDGLKTLMDIINRIRKVKNVNNVFVNLV